MNCEKISDLKEKKKFNHIELEKIELIERVKKFSVEKLNYNKSESYSTFFDQNNRSLIWIVTGCDQFSFSPYFWDFPILGNLTYKGYFDSLKANKEKNRLVEIGFDADINSVQAWSTLGYLNDPIFSEMLKKSKPRLVELIFHELFHGTIYAPGSVNLNENLAEFIAKNATLEFYKSDSLMTQEYYRQLYQEEKLNRFMLQSMESLDQLYKEMTVKKYRITEKIRRKKVRLSEIISQLNNINFLTPKQKIRISKGILDSGNSYFLHFKRYNSMEDSLGNILKNRFNGKLDLMIKDLKKEISSL